MSIMENRNRSTRAPVIITMVIRRSRVLPSLRLFYSNQIPSVESLAISRLLSPRPAEGLFAFSVDSLADPRLPKPGSPLAGEAGEH